MNTVLVDEVYCKGCRLCVETCPAGALGVSQKRNAKGYLLPWAENPEACTGCLSCELICPDLAITVEKEAHEN